MRAEVSCEPARDSAVFCAPRRLTIAREGLPPFQEPFTGDADFLARSEAGQKPLEVLDLDGDGEPEVLLNLYSGGAHCCFSTRIYFFAGEPARYDSLLQKWGNPGYRLEDLDHDGKTELVTGDDRFAYAFTSYAASRLPPRIWRYSSGALEEVTRSFPSLLEEDGTSCWKAFLQQSPGDPTGDQTRGLAAAYLADECLLGRSSEGWRLLIESYKKPDRKKFFAALTDLLAKTGYTSR